MQLPIPPKYIDTPYYPTLEADPPNDSSCPSQLGQHSHLENEPDTSDALADHIQLYLNAGWYSITGQIASQVTYTWHYSDHALSINTFPYKRAQWMQTVPHYTQCVAGTTHWGTLP